MGGLGTSVTAAVAAVVAVLLLAVVVAATMSAVLVAAAAAAVTTVVGRAPLFEALVLLLYIIEEVETEVAGALDFVRIRPAETC